MPIDRSGLILNCSLSLDGTLHASGTAVPEKLTDAMVEALKARGEIVRRGPSAPATSVDEAVPADAPKRLPPEAAIDPTELAGLELDELNVMAAEKGWSGEPFADEAVARNYLSANYVP